MNRLRGGQVTAWAVILLAIVTVIVGFIFPFDVAMVVIAAMLVAIIILSLLTTRALAMATIGPVDGTAQTLSIGGYVLTVLGVTTALGWQGATDEAAQYYLQALAVYTVVLHIILGVMIRRATRPTTPAYTPANP